MKIPPRPGLCRVFVLFSMDGHIYVIFIEKENRKREKAMKQERKITIYHASDHAIEEPYLPWEMHEFGRGFYTWINKDWAIEYAKRSGLKVVNKYELDLNAIKHKNEVISDYWTMILVNTYGRTIDEWNEINHEFELIDPELDAINAAGFNDELLGLFRDLIQEKIDKTEFTNAARSMDLPREMVILTPKGLNALSYQGTIILPDNEE